MTIQFINHQEWGIDPGAFEPYVTRLEKTVKPLEGVLNVVFVNDNYIQALNKNYRNKDEATDVLSFNYQDDGDQHHTFIGEIYISVQRARLQAAEHYCTFQDELNKLFVHGFLHIHGYDHEKDEDYVRMSELEERVLA